MKKLLFALLIATTVSTGAFASDANKVNIRVLNSFRTEFSDAADVLWTLRADFTKATFKMNGTKMEAFFDMQGKMIGTSQHITLDELPTSAKRAFAKRYAGYTVTEAIRFDGTEENAYYISADNASEKVVLKVGSGDQLSVFQKTKKQ